MSRSTPPAAAIPDPVDAVPHTAVVALVDTLVARVVAVSWDHLGESTHTATRALVLDALGLAAAAPAAPSMAATARALARAGGAATAEDGVHVPFWGRFAGPADAAAALSVAVHAWDFDDTHDDAVVHTACVALPAALSVAQQTGAGGRAVLEGVVAGVEVLSRLSLVVGPRPGVIRTAGLASLAAAVAAARVLRLDRAATTSALALALPAALAPASRQVVSDSAVNKRHQPSYGVHAGVVSAYLAAAGVAGPPGWFGGEHGLVQHVGDPGAARRHLDRAGWEVERVSLKPVPACRYGHAAVTGTLELTGGRPAPHAAVHVQLPVGAAHRMVARPFERRGQPIVDAQFSVPWLVAAALVRGGVGLAEMTEEILLEPEIERVAREQVTVCQDQDPGDRVMTPVRVHLTDSDRSDCTVVDTLPGSPERPLTGAEQRAKLRGCLAVTGRSTESVDELVDDLRSLVDALPDLGPDGLTRRLHTLSAPAGPASPDGGHR